MKHEKKRVSIFSGRRGQAAATACFLLLSGLFVYGCVWMVVGVLRQELLSGNGKQPESPGISASASPRPVAPDTPAPEEPAQDVAAMLVPQAPGESTALPGGAEGTPAPVLTPVPTATPVPTLRPPVSAAPFSGDCAEFVLIGFDERERADWFAAVSMRQGRCTVLCVPRNTCSASGTPLQNAASVTHATRLLRTVWPVNYPYYVELKLPGVPLCVEQCGGVTMEGTPYTGEQVEAYLAGNTGDELLRIGKQQALMRAFLKTLQQQSWLKLLTFKFTLQEFVDSNLSTAQLLELYTHFLKLDVDDVTFSTLPVDSLTAGGERYYTPDAAMVNRLLETREAE